MDICFKCNAASAVQRVAKCFVCFKHVCEKCGTRRYGKIFCSTSCARIFFIGTGEEYED